MAIYRTVQMGFWTDTKIGETYSTDEKLLYLYFLTNPHTNLAGCYEISNRQIAFETGFTPEKVGKLLDSLQDKGVVGYSQETAEILVVNWHKYNWTTSPKLIKPLTAEIEAVKCEKFRNYLQETLENGDAEYSIDRVSEKPDRVSNNPVKPKKDDTKQTYGEYSKIKLKDSEYAKLCEEYGEDITNRAINYLDSYKAEKGYTSKSDYLTIRRWVIDAVTKGKGKQATANTGNTTSINDYLMAQAMGADYEQTGNF